MLNNETAKLTYVSLFSGAGLGCLGLSLAGFQCVATVEVILRRLKIQQYNEKCFLTSGYICGDLSKLSTKEKIFSEISKWDLDSSLNRLDIVVATPPCQGMSVCNHKKGNEIKRNSLALDAIEIVEQTRPKIFIFENTSQFLKTKCEVSGFPNKTIGNVINHTLGKYYNIITQRLNLKNYGCLSSRTRIIVIGTDKNLWFSPFSIMPDWRPVTSLRSVIGDLPRINYPGDISKDDIFHAAKSYPSHMREWIIHLREGQSAFEQSDELRRPHKVINGKIVENINVNGDKYRRQIWDAVSPCVHTRNDIMASQNTVHPSDDRVFSIRELMRFLSVPENFRWTDIPHEKLSSSQDKTKKLFLRTNEMNIRQCLGEAAPTEVLRTIAQKCKACLSQSSRLNSRDLCNKIFTKKNNGGRNSLDNANLGYNLEKTMCQIELSNMSREKNAAYYTPPTTAFKLLHMIPDFKPNKKIRVLEPSAGIGRLLHFLPQLLVNYDEVVIDAMDIDKDALECCRSLATKIVTPKNVRINYISGDFLTRSFDNVRYDLVLGNPPFGRIPIASKANYADLLSEAGSNNIFSLFLTKALQMARYVLVIAPKSMLSSPDFDKLRLILNSKHTILDVCDFGEKGFKGVKIETIALSIKTNRKQKYSDLINIESIPLKCKQSSIAAPIFSSDFPYWLIYRNETFNNLFNKMKFNIFSVFRDRQISKKDFCSSGVIRLIKSRNIAPVKYLRISSDYFINNVNRFTASKFINRSDVILVPNLSYNPRACRMPPDSIADGSVAVLIPNKNCNGQMTDDDLFFYSTEEFKSFYRIARNNGTRSLNIDSNSVFFFGTKI